MSTVYVITLTNVSDPYEPVYKNAGVYKVFSNRETAEQFIKETPDVFELEDDWLDYWKKPGRVELVSLHPTIREFELS
mgnify:FL=1